MKNILIGLLLLTTLVFGGLYLTQHQKAIDAKSEAASLQQKLAESESSAAQQEERTTTLQTKLRDTQAKAIAKSEEVTQISEALTNRIRSQTNAKPANPFGEMFKSKEMKDMIKTQQKTVLGGMIDKNYAPYFASLNLTPEQSASLKDLILNRGLVDAEAGMSMLSGDNDPDKRKEIMDKTKADRDAINGQIKDFVGDENYKQFETYEKSIPDRMSLNMYKDQQGSGPGALNPDQEALLIQAMGEERQNFKFTTDFSDQSKLNGDLASYFTEDKINKFYEESDALNQRYLDRAKTILTPEQLDPYTKFLNSQRELQKAGFKMAMTMFGGQKNGN
jgi:Tfp pilus assembly protein PilX